MRRIVTWAMSTLTVLVLLFSYHTSRDSSVAATAETRQVTTSSRSTTGDDSAASSTQEPADSSGSSSSSGTSSGTSGTASGTTASGDGASQTYDGDAVMTRYGNVQVQITVASGEITAVDVLQVPMEDRHDQMINSRAVPIYAQEVLATQSADIDVVSGATVTWEGYTQSLQSAIDAAHL